MHPQQTRLYHFITQISQTTDNNMKIRLLLYSFILCTLSATAQTGIDNTARKALVMGRTLVPEYVYLHFDNSAYYLGETMWFKAHVTSGNSDKASTMSKVLYVELVAPEGYIVETKKYKLDDSGSCHGEFELNPLLLSGYYEVRAYTRYMLNRSNEAPFSRVFPIFDKVNANNWDFKNMLDRKRGFMYRGEWISATLPDCSLTFYPEGGHLVAGLPTRVAYELRGHDGTFGSDTIVILEDGERVLATIPTHNGKGSFNLTPKDKSKYTAQVKSADKKGKRKSYKFDLPETQPEGVAISIMQDSANVRIEITHNHKKSRELALALLHRGVMGFYKKLPAEQNKHTFTLAKSTLFEGVTRAVIFDEALPLAERQFFVIHDQLQNSDRQTVKLNVKGNNYDIHNLKPQAHEKITIDVEREDGSPIESSAQFSVAVTDASGKQSTSWDYNMYTYLLLGSELKGYIPNASQYFSPENEQRHAQLDLIMLTHGWTSYDWSKLIEARMSDLQPVERGITLKGTLYKNSKQERKLGRPEKTIITPEKGNLTSLQFSYDDKTVEERTFRTDTLGNFVIELDNFYGKKVGKLIPTDNYRFTDNVWYSFSLDRYYSPKFRLYDYWERNLGASVASPASDSLIKLNPFEYMLGPLEITASKSNERYSRPPHSEMRFDYLDEWEYAQDVTFLKEAASSDALTDLAIYDDFLTNITDLETSQSNPEESEEQQEAAALGLDPIEHLESKEVDIYANLSPSGIYKIGSKSDHSKYLGRIHYIGTKTADHFMGTVAPGYARTLTADDVVRSAMYRHNYNWAYWVQLMVVTGAYDPYKIPHPDYDYYKGKEPEKMVNFKEIIIRSDEGTRKQFENTSISWGRKAATLNTKEPYTKFYLGFLSQSYLIAREGVDNAPMPEVFLEQLKAGQISHNSGSSSPFNPNYVACLIPQTESTSGPIVPDFSNMSDSRYTSIQGYNESKQFYSPDYGTMRPTAPNDHRRTLLWIPTIEAHDGKMRIELYNSSLCDAIEVSINGVDGNTFYSNDSNTLTRIGKQKESQEQQQPSSTSDEESQQRISYSDEDRRTLERMCEDGDIYYNQKKYHIAVRRYAELLEYNYPPAIRKVGLCHIHGHGVAKNTDKAIEFLTLAAEYGDGIAMYTLAQILHSDKQRKDDAKALEWFKRAEKSKAKEITANLARHYYDGTIVERDTTKAYTLYRTAATTGNAEALYMYAKYMLQQNIESDQQLGSPISCIERAAKQSHTEAMLYMMNHHHNTQQYKEAYTWARELHQKGVKEGTLYMADCYEKGQGVKRDKRLAEDLRREAQ